MESIFSRKLKEERLKNKLTQQQLADLINEERKVYDDSDFKVSRVSITRYENGTRTPDYTTLRIISYILKTDIDYLLGKSNRKYQEGVNIELDDFVKYVKEIAEKDDLNINNFLWPMICKFKNLLKQGISNDSLEIVSRLILLIDGFINYSINTNEPIILNDLEEILKKYYEHNLNKSRYILKIEHLEELKKHEKELIALTESFNSSESKASIQKMLKENNNEQRKIQLEIQKLNEKQKKIQSLLD